ncbi:CCA tRNA nucleotidyltransferase [Sphingosinicella sp.]|uniref:CCA tRNA nucleotidyltransferase n=1 Tax=Sphingosinicella sp. TaxID=1917971 RepID=UPI004037E038
MTMTLPDAEWRHWPGMDRLLAALDASAGETRFVGGCVRDALLGIEVSDVDLATRLAPDEVIARLGKARIKAVPTGIAHGTVTAVIHGRPVQVTTLRRDIETFGRRATVAFTDDWREDAARRDFTINALSAEPESGAIHDYFSGLADIAARRVRFIGDPLPRIAEDHLRILRFFRFHARFGAGTPDAAGTDACAARANDLMALSRERIADELLKLLALPDPAPTVALMIKRGILKPVVPEIASTDRLARLVAHERAADQPPHPIRRLAALLPSDAETASAIGTRLRLSKTYRARLIGALAESPAAPREAAYRFGTAVAIDQLLLSDRNASAIAAAVADLTVWSPPKLPIKGGAIVARGIGEGPEVARLMRAVEKNWIAEGFPDRRRVDAIADEVVAQALRSRQ